MLVTPNNEFFGNVEQMLTEGKSVELNILGSSMQPYLRGDGKDIIIISPFSPEELTPGAIVLFRYRSKYICHRIIRRQEEKLLIQGDGSIVNSEQVLVSDVVGIIRTVIRRNKKPVSTQSKAAKLYWSCWKHLFPVRKYLLYAYRLWLRI